MLATAAPNSAEALYIPPNPRLVMPTRTVLSIEACMFGPRAILTKYTAPGRDPVLLSTELDKMSPNALPSPTRDRALSPMPSW